MYESYKMVQEPTVANPSGKWTNFTDGSCKELIYVTDDMRLTARYLMKCDAVDCCHEEQDGNHVSRRAPGSQGCNATPLTPLPSLPTPHTQNDQDEYQIPNVHPAILAPVTYKGQEQVEIDPDVRVRGAPRARTSPRTPHQPKHTRPKQDGDPYFIKGDVWMWKFLLETYYAITVNSTNGAPALLRWAVEVEGQQFNNTCVCKQPLHDRARAQTSAMSCP